MILRPLNVKEMEEGHGIYEYRGPKLYFDENSMEMYPVRSETKEVLQDTPKEIPIATADKGKELKKVSSQVMENNVQSFDDEKKKKLLYLGAGILALRFLFRG